MQLHFRAHVKGLFSRYYLRNHDNHLKWQGSLNFYIKCCISFTLSAAYLILGLIHNQKLPKFNKTIIYRLAQLINLDPSKKKQIYLPVSIL